LNDAIARSPQLAQPEEQLRYARWLDRSSRVGLALLVLGFLAYVSGAMTPHVPTHRLPEVWGLPVADYLRATGTPSGWHWVALVQRGDIVNLVGIGVLAGCSMLCLLVLLPLYLRRGDGPYAALCIAEVAVVLLAASGVLTSGH
jgi:hypothetical protein